MIGKLNLNGNSKATTSSIYGVYRDMSSSNTTWTRTGGAVGLTANATHDGSEVENDFDNIYPWSDIISQDVSEDGTVNASYGDANFSFTDPVGRIMTYFPRILVATLSGGYI